MDIRVLQYFLAVAREENITKAAQLLHITQPTLSRQLMGLEQELGVKLFSRSSHSITLTEEGMLFRRRAEEIVTLSEMTKRELKQEAMLTGEISIGSGEYHGSCYLSGILAATMSTADSQLLTAASSVSQDLSQNVFFRAEHPNVTYSIYSGNSDNIKERIERGTLDIGLLLEPVEISKYDFLHFPVPETWNALVRSDSPLAQKPYLTPQDIVPYPVVFSRRDQIRSEIANWFGDSADRLNIIAHGNLQYNMASVIRRENGVLFTLKLDLQHNGLKFVPLQPPIRAATVLVWKNRVLSPLTNAFLDFAKKYISGMEKDKK